MGIISVSVPPRSSRNVAAGTAFYQGVTKNVRKNALPGGVLTVATAGNPGVLRELLKEALV